MEQKLREMAHIVLTYKPIDPLSETQIQEAAHLWAYDNLSFNERQNYSYDKIMDIFLEHQTNNFTWVDVDGTLFDSQSIELSYIDLFKQDSIKFLY